MSICSFKGIRWGATAAPVLSPLPFLTEDPKRFLRSRPHRSTRPNWERVGSPKADPKAKRNPRDPRGPAPVTAVRLVTTCGPNWTPGARTGEARRAFLFRNPHDLADRRAVIGPVDVLRSEKDPDGRKLPRNQRDG